MKVFELHRPLTLLIAMVWFINGFFCKILNLVPRHHAIVARILGPDHAILFTIAIGVAEVLMAIWILSGIKARYAAIFQMCIVAAMNILEFILTPDLLLFGKLNIVIAFIFILIIYFCEFKLKQMTSRQSTGS